MPKYFVPVLEHDEEPVALDPDGLPIIWKPDLKIHLNGKDAPNNEFRPYHYGDRLVLVCGRRGSGKSWFTTMYIEGYNKTTDNKVFFISRLTEDESIKLPDRSLRISINDLCQAVANHQICLEDFSDSLMVFDDINSASINAKQQAVIQSFLTDVMENSRHMRVSVLITNHMFSNGMKTRALLNEVSDIVVFPKYNSVKQIRYGFETYIGMSKQMIDDIMRTEDRWVMVHLAGLHKYILSSHHVEAMDLWAEPEPKAKKGTGKGTALAPVPDAEGLIPLHYD